MGQGRHTRTVDADFEVLHPRFVEFMLKRLEGEADLVGISTDYSATGVVQPPISPRSCAVNRASSSRWNRSLGPSNSAATRASGESVKLRRA